MKVLAAICAALLLTLAIVGWQLRQALRTVGQQAAEIDMANRTAHSNKLAYDRSLQARDAAIEALQQARARSDAAAAASIASEREAAQRVDALEKSLREAVRHDPESIDWSAVRVPDAVIDRLRGAEAAATAGADHRNDQDRSGTHP